MNPKNLSSFVPPNTPEPAEPLVEVWEPPFERWLRLTETLVGDQASVSVLRPVLPTSKP
jgi:hypothetical protein